jgi:hypothetical protein
VPIDPREWKDRKNLTIDVGFGAGDRQERAQMALALIALQEKALVGGMSMLVTPKQLYNSAAEFCRANRIVDVSRYFTDPGEEAEMPEPAPDPEIVKAQMESQLKQQEMQMKAEIEKVQAEADIATQQLKTQSEIQLAERKFQLERELKIIELQMKQADREATIEHEDKQATRKLRFEANAQRIKDGDEFDGEGRVVQVQPIAEALASKFDALLEEQKKTQALVSKPRRTKVVRDKKGKAVESISTVDD